MATDSDPVRAPDGDEANSRPAELAAEYVAAQSAGESPDLSAYLARCGNDEERAELRDLVDAAGRAARGLPRDLLIGSRIATRYRITGEIASGGMGRVYSAHDEKLGRDVAVKVLAPLAQGNREWEELFDKEWRILAELKHPGIVSVYDAGNDGQRTYIVMELVDGTALSDVIDRAARALAAGGIARNGELLARSIGKPLAPGLHELIDPHDYARSVARIVLEIARTLEAAHGKKVIHRDLKPANVMLLGGGAPIVLDFGLAASPQLRKTDASEKFHGSYPYVAPEQVKSEKAGTDPRSDVYQIGLLLYEMLTLRRAFPGSAIGDVLQRIQQGFFEKPRKIERTIPRDLEAICMKALEVDPDRRYASARAMREDIEAWLEGRAPAASRGARWRSFVRTARYTARRHPVITSVAGMVLVGFATWAVFAVSDPGPETSFFRMVQHGKQFTMFPIRERRQQVETGDFIGFTLRSAGDIDLYAISVYGSEKDGRFVSPWKATDMDHPDRILTEKQADETWGFHVARSDDPELQILCTQLRPENPANELEGLLVLIPRKPEDKPKLEGWMDRLWNMEHQGLAVPWEKAEQMLTEASTDRGPHGKGEARVFDPDERLGMHDAVNRPGKKAPFSLRLRNVTEYAIECRTAGL